MYEFIDLDLQLLLTLYAPDANPYLPNMYRMDQVSKTKKSSQPTTSRIKIAFRCVFSLPVHRETDRERSSYRSSLARKSASMARKSYEYCILLAWNMKNSL